MEYTGENGQQIFLPNNVAYTEFFQLRQPSISLRLYDSLYFFTDLTFRIKWSRKVPTSTAIKYVASMFRMCPNFTIMSLS